MKKFKILSTFFIIILGTILHFTYEWSNNNQIVGAFSAVNESTWEHLKLLFFPMLITTIVGYFYFKEISNLLCGKVFEILTAMVFTTSVYYTYTGIIGRDIAFVNILIFILAVIVGEFVNYIVINSNFKCNKKVAVVMLIALAVLFVLFTYNTPEIGIFKDPVTGGYGV